MVNNYNKYLLEYLRWRVETDKGQIITVSSSKIHKFLKWKRNITVSRHILGHCLREFFNGADIVVRRFYGGHKGGCLVFQLNKEDLKRWLDEHLEGN